MTGSSLLPLSASVSRFLDAVLTLLPRLTALPKLSSVMCVSSLSCFYDISNPLLFLLPLSLTHQVPQNITMVLMTGTDPTIVTMVLTRQLQFLRDVSASSVTHPPGASAHYWDFCRRVLKTTCYSKQFKTPLCHSPPECPAAETNNRETEF